MPSPSVNSEDVPRQIHVLTLNCWGLKYLAKYRRERLLEIGRRLANSDYPPDIVALQECWTQEDYHNICRETRHILPYGKFYYSGIFGGGLAILSKWPIEESSMVPYPLNGRPTAFFRGDWFVGKGVACARIRFGPARKDVAEVFCTHLHAPYEKEPNDSYICHRTAQAWEIAKLMRGAADRGHLVIGMGDFNMLPLSLAHRLITLHSPVHDVWRHLHPNSSIGAAADAVERARKKPIPSAEYNIRENGATCDGIYNTWRWSKEDRGKLRRGPVMVDGTSPDPLAKRLDYIFVGDGSYASSTAWKWTIESAKVSMTERHPTLHCSLSDHFAVEAVIRRESQEPVQHDASTIVGDGDDQSSFLPIQRHGGSLRPGLASLQSSGSLSAASPWSPKKELKSFQPDTFPPTRGRPTDMSNLYDQILSMISVYTVRERFQRRMRLGHFLVSLVVAISCLTGIWWSPRPFVSFIMCLISTLCLAGGVVDGLIGGLFVSSELRSLKEFEWEIRTARRIALGMGLDIERDLSSPGTKY
jgi:sphingomyelin phosphodiesterase 2